MYPSILQMLLRVVVIINLNSFPLQDLFLYNAAGHNESVEISLHIFELLGELIGILVIDVRHVKWNILVICLTASEMVHIIPPFVVIIKQSFITWQVGFCPLCAFLKKSTKFHQALQITITYYSSLASPRSPSIQWRNMSPSGVFCLADVFLIVFWQQWMSVSQMDELI